MFDTSSVLSLDDHNELENGYPQVIEDPKVTWQDLITEHTTSIHLNIIVLT